MLNTKYEQLFGLLIRGSQRRMLSGLVSLFVAMGATISAPAQFSYTTNSDGSATVSGYTGAGGAVVIPSTLDSRTVTAVGEFAFFYATNLTSATLPSSINSIGVFAFANCITLTNLTIPSIVTNIGYGAFASCSSLTSMTIPASVINIGNSLFLGCYALSKVYFLGNAPTIDGSDGSADTTVFPGASGAVYYLAGTTGWNSTFGGWPTVAMANPAKPQLSTGDRGFGTNSNRFNITITWPNNTNIIVEASTNFINWLPISTNILVNGTNAFSDPRWTNFPNRFYRARSL